MDRWMLTLGYAAIAVLAYRVSHSVCGFLLTGCGLAVLLHRCPRLQTQLEWRREALRRAGWFLVGTIFFYYVRPGVVSLAEAAYRGVMVCLAAALAEAVVRRVGRPWRLALAACVVVLVPWAVAVHPLHTVPKRTPAALGLAFEDVRFASGDGTPLAAWVMPHAAARGNVIYCHGHGRNRGQGAVVFTTLHALGLNVVAFDFRGHGDSGGHTSTFGDREVDDLLAAVRYCRARFPGRPLFLTGVSLGSAVTLQALSRIPDVCGVWSEAAFSRFGATVEHQFDLLPRPLRRALVKGYYLLSRLDCGFWPSAIRPVDRLGGVRVPIFFCHGRKDRLVPCSQGRELYDAYTGPKYYWWVAGAGHANIRQRNPQEYRRQFQAFVERCLGSAR